MNTMTESRNLAVQGRQKMTPSEAFVETLVANGVTDMFGIVGSAYMDAMDIFPPAGIRFIPVAHEQGGGAHGRRLCARVRPPRRVHRAERSRHHATSSPSIAAAYWAHSPVVVITPETGTMTHRPRRLPGDRAAADLLEDHQVPGARQQSARAWPSSPAARSTARCSRWGRRSSTSRATTSTARSNARSRGRIAHRARRGRRAEPRRGGRTARARRSSR